MLLLLISNVMNLGEVAKRLGFTDNRSTKKWLNKNSIPISKRGRDCVIYEFHLVFQIQLELVEQLKALHPDDWSEIYDATTEDKRMVKAIFQKHPPVKATRTTKGTGKRFFK